MAYLLVTSANVTPGKRQEAIQWAQKAAAYITDKYSELTVQIMENINGPVNQLHWVESWDTLAPWEEYAKQVDADSGWQALLAEGGGLFDADSIVRKWYRPLS